MNSHAPSPKPFLLPGHKFFLAPLYYLPTLQVDQLPFIDHSFLLLANQCLIASTIAHFSFMIISWLSSAYLHSVYIYSFSIDFYLLMSHFRYIYQVSEQQSDSDSALKEKWGESFKLDLVS